jgi:hypothetical protein
MQKLAQEFGISDVGLAKLCRQHEIPLPGRGYWSRIQFGQKLERPILPVPKDSRLGAIAIKPSEGPPARSSLEEEVTIPKIVVSADRPLAHNLVSRIEKSMSGRNKDERGMLLAKAGIVVPVKVSEIELARALRILDAFLRRQKLQGDRPDLLVQEK